MVYLSHLFNITSIAYSATITVWREAPPVHYINKSKGLSYVIWRLPNSKRYFSWVVILLGHIKMTCAQTLTYSGHCNFLTAMVICDRVMSQNVPRNNLILFQIPFKLSSSRTGSLCRTESTFPVAHNIIKIYYDTMRSDSWKKCITSRSSIKELIPKIVSWRHW